MMILIRLIIGSLFTLASSKKKAEKRQIRRRNGASRYGWGEGEGEDSRETRWPILPPKGPFTPSRVSTFPSLALKGAVNEEGETAKGRGGSGGPKVEESWRCVEASKSRCASSSSTSGRKVALPPSLSFLSDLNEGKKTAPPKAVKAFYACLL